MEGLIDGVLPESFVLKVVTYLLDRGYTELTVL